MPPGVAIILPDAGYNLAPPGPRRPVRAVQFAPSGSRLPTSGNRASLRRSAPELAFREAAFREPAFPAPVYTP